MGPSAVKTRSETQGEQERGFDLLHASVIQGSDECPNLGFVHG